MKKQLLSAGMFMLTLLCGGLLVWGAGQYLKSDGTPDFQKLKSTANGNKLTADMRDDLMDGLSKMQQGGSSQPTTTVVDVPAGAVMAFDLSACPSGWSRWTKADDRFLMGASSQFGSIGGNAKIKLTIDQLPPHSFKLKIENNKWGDNAQRREFPRNWGTSTSTSTISTNTLGSGREINIMNPYVKVIYCKKN